MVLRTFRDKSKGSIYKMHFADEDEANTYTPPDDREPIANQAEPTAEELAQSERRAKRDALLRETDWTQLPDAPVDQKRWAIYRQQLRDMNFDKPEWPEQPGNGMMPEDTLRIEKHLDRAARTILFDGKNKP